MEAAGPEGKLELREGPDSTACPLRQSPQEKGVSSQRREQRPRSGGASIQQREAVVGTWQQTGVDTGA